MIISRSIVFTLIFMNLGKFFSPSVFHFARQDKSLARQDKSDPCKSQCKTRQEWPMQESVQDNSVFSLVLHFARQDKRCLTLVLSCLAASLITTNITLTKWSTCSLLLIGSDRHCATGFFLFNRSAG